jgi:cytochrome c
MTLAALAAVAATSAAPAKAEEMSDSAIFGLGLVTIYCSDCHAVREVGESPHAPAPPFRELHLRYEVEALAEALVEGIVAHPDMPEFEFDPNQAEAIIAYLKTLE